MTLDKSLVQVYEGFGAYALPPKEQPFPSKYLRRRAVDAAVIIEQPCRDLARLYEAELRQQIRGPPGGTWYGFADGTNSVRAQDRFLKQVRLERSGNSYSLHLTLKSPLSARQVARLGYRRRRLMLDIGFIKELYLPGLLTAVSQCLHHWNDKSGKYLSPFKESQPFFPYGPWKREDPIQHRPFDANASRTFPASPHDPPLLEFLLGIAIGGGVYKSGATVKLAAGR